MVQRKRSDVDLQDLLRFLSHTTLFTGLPAKVGMELCREMIVKTLKKGDTLFRSVLLLSFFADQTNIKYCVCANMYVA